MGANTSRTEMDYAPEPGLAAILQYLIQRLANYLHSKTKQILVYI